MQPLQPARQQKNAHTSKRPNRLSLHRSDDGIKQYVDESRSDVCQAVVIFGEIEQTTANGIRRLEFR